MEVMLNCEWSCGLVVSLEEGLICPWVCFSLVGIEDAI